jgi:putative addiction module component (TIGR02574 family)
MTQLEQLCALPTSERMQLVEDLWDSIAESPSEVRLTKAQTIELDRRLDDMGENPKAGIEWSELKSKILNSL